MPSLYFTATQPLPLRDSDGFCADCASWQLDNVLSSQSQCHRVVLETDVSHSLTECCTSLSSELKMRQHMNVALPWCCFLKNTKVSSWDPLLCSYSRDRKHLSTKYCLRKLTVEYMLLAFSFQILIYLGFFGDFASFRESASFVCTYYFSRKSWFYKDYVKGML